MTLEQIILEQNATLLDVREPFELTSEGSVPNAINIPLGELEDKIDEIRELKAPIVIFCRSGNRSLKAISILEDEGLTDLYDGMGFKDILDIIK